MTTKKGLTSGISKNRAAGKDANLERTVGDESFSACQGQAFTTPVSVRVTHYRCRLADPDGLSIKAALDGIIHCGLLPDDSAKEIAEIRHFQCKVKNAEDERTEIEIEAVK